MPYSTPSTSESSHGNRFVEYIDVFSQKDIIPSAAIPNQLLLFDTFDGINPLESLYQESANKMYQKLYIYVTKGKYVIEINGTEETLTAGMLITIMPENVTRTLFISTDCNYFMLVLYPKLANQIYTDIGLTYSNARMSLRHFVSTLTEEQMRRTQTIYSEIKSDILGEDYEFKEKFIENLLNVITIENINIHNYNPMPLQGNSNSRQYDIYCRFLALLNKHSIEHRSVQYYADQLGISSKYLSFVCISYSKKNASTWIDESVIQKAKAYMIVHHYSFSETSEMLHFPSMSSFSRFFKRATGVTPKEFVKAQTT